MSFLFIFIPDVKAMMPSHVGRIKHQNNAKLKTNSFCRHRSESLNLIYMDSMTFKRNAERHFPRMLNVECEYELAQHLFDNKCRPIAESQWCLKGNVLLLRRLIVIRQSVDTRCQTDVAQIPIQTPNLTSWQSAAQHSS